MNRCKQHRSARALSFPGLAAAVIRRRQRARLESDFPPPPFRLVWPRGQRNNGVAPHNITASRKFTQHDTCLPAPLSLYTHVMLGNTRRLITSSQTKATPNTTSDSANNRRLVKNALHIKTRVWILVLRQHELRYTRSPRFPEHLRVLYLPILCILMLLPLTQGTAAYLSINSLSIYQFFCFNDYSVSYQCVKK